MSAPIFPGVVRDGRLHADAPEKVSAHLATLEGLRVGFKVEDLRSLDAHRYLFGVVYAAISDHTGHSVEALHEFFKRKFLSRTAVRITDPETGEFEEVEVVESSTIQGRRAFWEFTDRVKLFAAEFMGLEIPEADPALRAPRRRKRAA